MLGRQRGILAAAMNAINSGQLTVTLGMALHSIVHSGSIAAIIMILLSAALSAAVWIFLRNLYQAVLRRAVLETRSYDALPMSHLFYLKSVRRWVRAALTLLLESLFESLWALTIVGWPIKHYSYFLVPFIVAENPDVRPREAITLSRRMMNGHKWECFKLEFSFIGWMILGFVTFGAADVLWSVPYRVTAYAEYYALLREAARIPVPTMPIRPAAMPAAAVSQPTASAFLNCFFIWMCCIPCSFISKSTMYFQP